MSRTTLQAIDLLAKHPEVGLPGRVMGTRELVVASTSFVIPYRIRRGGLELIGVYGHQKWPEKF